MALLKVDISPQLMKKIEEDMIKKNLTKKQLVGLILETYFGNPQARDVLFGFNLLGR